MHHMYSKESWFHVDMMEKLQLSVTLRMHVKEKEMWTGHRDEMHDYTDVKMLL